jgi:hypothetical protein
MRPLSTEEPAWAGFAETRNRAKNCGCAAAAKNGIIYMFSNNQGATGK